MYDVTNALGTHTVELRKGEYAQLLTQFPCLTDGKCVMITGAAGFIGSWMGRSLVHTYQGAYKVVAFDKLEYAASTNNFKSLQGNPAFSFECGDITSEEDVLRALEKHKVDTIIHFAAQTNVDASFDDPYGFANTNVHGCHVLLTCAKKSRVKRFLHMSSYEAYGSSKPGPRGHSETEPLCPVNPYAASKACGEIMALAFGQSSDMDVFVIRSQNVYGPNQYPEKIIPKFSMLINRGMMLPLYGAGNNTRRYVFVGDVVDAFNIVMHKGTPGEVYNIGSDTEISNKELCGLLLRKLSPPSDDTDNTNAWLEPTPDRPFHDRGTSLDCAKLIGLGWRQSISMDDGIKLTVEWYKEFSEAWWGVVLSGEHGSVDKA